MINKVAAVKSKLDAKKYSNDTVKNSMVIASSYIAA